MRIAQMIDNVHIGGAQKMQLILAEAMQQQDHVDLTLIVLETNKRKTAIPEKLEALGVNVHYFPAKKLLSFGRLRQLRRFLKEGEYDLVHAHLTYANIIGTITGRLAGIPTIASFRSIRPDSHPIRGRLEAFLLSYVTTSLMAVGHSTAAAHQHRVGKKEITAIPNSVKRFPPPSEKERRSLRQTLVGDFQRPILITVGRLIKMKGFDILLNAFATARQQHPTATLLIAGSGPDHDRLADQIKALDLNDHAHLLGPRNDIVDLLAASDIFVNASHWEGLSNALLEAMAAGLPAIATNTSDTPRVVVPGTGLLIPTNDESALTEAIITLLGDEQKRLILGRAARQHMAQAHSLENWTQQILTLWHTALNGRLEKS